MEPTLATPADTCREFLGIQRGWCPKSATVWLDHDGFCGQHATERQVYAARGGA